jgi:preprotein translocase subunit SecD
MKRLLLGWLAVLLLAGCAGMDEKDKTHVLVHEQSSEALPAHTWFEAELKAINLKIPVNRYPSLTDNDVTEATLVPTVGGAALSLQFDPLGTMRLLEMTTRCRGKYLVIFFNEKPVAAWLCDKVLSKGQLLIEGDFTDEEAQQAVKRLNKDAKKRKAL